MRGRGERRVEVGQPKGRLQELGWDGVEKGRRVHKPEIVGDLRLRRNNMHKEVVLEERDEVEERPVSEINDLD